LKTEGIDVSSVARTDLAPTGTALIIVSDSGENSIVVVPGANAVLASGYLDEAEIGDGDVVICQCEVPLETVTRGFELARQVGALTVLNPAPVQEGANELLELADVLVVNESELSVLLGLPATPSAQEVVVDSARCLRRSGDQIVVVTLGARGAVAIKGERAVIMPGRSVQAVDTTGAGDCFVGTMAARLAARADLDEALDYANLAASLCVQRLGAGSSMPTAQEVDRLRRSGLEA
jgi:ribokinase